MTDATRKMTQSEINANNCMRHHMPVPINHLGGLETKLARACQHLEPLDAFNHDDQIPDELYAHLQDFDPVPKRLEESTEQLEKVLRASQASHRAIAGIFAGEDRDQLEEPLARGVRSAEDRLARMTECMNAYKMPRQPFAIRRGTLYTLETEFDLYARTWQNIRASCEGASEDLMVRLTEQVQELARLTAVLSKLRRMSSQKMGNHLAEIGKRLELVISELNAVQSEACGRVLGPDRRVIRAAA